MKKLIAISTSTLFLSGCLVTREDLRQTEGRRYNQDQVATMQKERVHSAPAPAAPPPPPVDPQNRIAELEETIRELNGRIEVAENKVNMAENSKSQQLKQLEDQLAESNRKSMAMAEEIEKLNGQISALNEQIVANQKANEEREEAAKNEKKSPFDLAEEHFGKKDWRKAILAYEKYRSANPKGKQFNEATYKIGVCFQELGMKDEARTFYEELVKKSPNSPEAKRAKIRLKKVK